MSRDRLVYAGVFTIEPQWKTTRTLNDEQARILQGDSGLQLWELGLGSMRSLDKLLLSDHPQSSKRQAASRSTGLFRNFSAACFAHGCGVDHG